MLVLLRYGFETWTLDKKDVKQTVIFSHAMSAEDRWNDFVSNATVSSMSGQDDIRAIVRAHRLGLFGHVVSSDCRVKGSNILAISCDSRDGSHLCATRRRPPDPPRTIWLHQVHGESRLPLLDACSWALDWSNRRAVAAATEQRFPLTDWLTDSQSAVICTLKNYLLTLIGLLYVKLVTSTIANFWSELYKDCYYYRTNFSV